MDSKDLIAFAAVYDARSITGAAKHLYMTPQGVSKIVNKLEAELGITLFRRSHIGVEPTPAADMLRVKAQDIVDLLGSVGRNTLVPNDQKTLRLASAYGVLAYLTLQFVSDFEKEHPDITLSITEGTDTYVDELVYNETADLGFLAGPIDAAKYDATFFSSHHHCVVVNQGNPLANKKTVSYSDLDGKRIALQGRNFHPFHNNMNRYIRAGVKPVIAMETSEIDFTHKLASLDQAIAISVDFAAFANPYSNTVIIPFEDATCTWDVYLAHKKGTVESDSAIIFSKFAYIWLEQNKSRLFSWPKSRA